MEHQLTPPGDTVSARAAPPFPAGLVVSLDTHDFDEMKASFRRWHQEYEQIGKGRFSGNVFMVHTSTMMVGMASWAPGILIRGRIPSDCVMLAMPLDDGQSPRIGGSELSSDGMAVVLDSEPADLRTTHPLRLFFVVVERGTLQGHADALIGSPLEAIRQHGQVAIENAPQKRRELDDLLKLLKQEVGRTAEHLRVPAIARIFEAMILAATLSDVRAPHGHSTAPRRRQLACEAEAFLRERLDATTTIRDICTAINASPRTLHLAFQEHVGMSPKAYMKVLRLNAVRHELRRAGELTTVTRTAMKWGFSHLGWFAQSYLQMFNESPIDTLRRARQSARANRGIAQLENGPEQVGDSILTQHHFRRPDAERQ